jgi:hypothetical protein
LKRNTAGSGLASFTTGGTAETRWCRAGTFTGSVTRSSRAFTGGMTQRNTVIERMTHGAHALIACRLVTGVAAGAGSSPSKRQTVRGCHTFSSRISAMIAAAPPAMSTTHGP